MTILRSLATLLLCQGLGLVNRTLLILVLVVSFAFIGFSKRDKCVGGVSLKQANMVEYFTPRQVNVARDDPERLLQLRYLIERIDHCHTVGLEVQSGCLKDVQKFLESALVPTCLVELKRRRVPSLIEARLHEVAGMTWNWTVLLERES